MSPALRTLVLALSTLTVGPLSDAAPSEGARGVLSWETCVAQAQQNNADLHAAIQAFSSTRELEGAARSGYFPQLTGQIGYSKSNPPAVVANHETAYATTLTASENLFSGFLDQGKYRQAKANTRVAESTLQITKARISFDLKSA